MERHDSARKQVYDCVMSLVREDYIQGTGGNVSVRIGDAELIAVTPSQVEYSTMTSEDICVVDFALNPVGENRYRPSMETGMHLAVYRNRPDAGAVVHTHQVFASIFALINMPIPALFDEVASSIGTTIEVVPYGLSGSPQLLENVAACLGSRANCYLLQNHGALCMGTDLAKAHRNAELLEKCARVYYYAMATGRPVTVLPPDIVTLMDQLVRAKQDGEVARREAALKHSC